MIKTFRRSLAAFAASGLLTTGAWADLGQSTDIAFFATSLFGPGSEALVLTPTGSEVVIETDSDIGAGNVAQITFSLTNGQFAGTVPLSSISVTGGGLSGVASFTKIAGGNAGQSTVTFQVAIVEDVLAGEAFIWQVPQITGASLSGSAAAVLAVSTIVPTTTAPDPFPNTIETNDCDNPGDCIIIATESPYTQFDLNSGNTGFVEIDNREVIAFGGTTITIPGTPVVVREGLLLGVHELDLDLISPPLQSDGDDFSVGTGGEGFGNVVLTVAGNLRAGDIVFADGNGNETIDAGESFTVAGSTATYTAPIDDVVGLNIPVYYVPNETDELTPTVFDFGAVTSYAIATNSSETATGPTPPGEIQYDGIFEFGYAYGVVRAGGSDVSFVRVTNENASSISAFFSCRDDAGNSYFGDAGTIPGNETVPYSSDDIGAILGGVVFQGRGACDVLADDKISVQHKIRAAGVLTDNSVVIGQNINPD